MILIGLCQDMVLSAIICVICGKFWIFPADRADLRRFHIEFVQADAEIIP